MRKLTVLIMIWMIIGASVAGCITWEEKMGEKLPEVVDLPAILPHFERDDHSYSEVIEILNEMNRTYPDLVEVFSIGKSVQGRDIWCIRITNENNTEAKLECIVDGCIHGNEVPGQEACLYFMYYLLTNYERNSTVRDIVDHKIINIIPILNPDGREANTRYNANNVDLNRNFDVDWGNPIGMAVPDPLGLGHPVQNCGSAPFSEPESRALRDFMEECNKDRNLAFYLNFHINLYCFISPWDCFNQPYKMPDNDRKVFDTVFEWVMDNTVYKATGYGGNPNNWSETSTGCYYVSGEAMDWCYLRHHVASFILEIYNSTMQPDDINYWCQTAMPILLYLLQVSPYLYYWMVPPTDIRIDMGGSR